ncbi:MAG TPA: ATP-binding protein, partial [Ktedonobacteraceae bacterium]|nr:ATP-binding protein [Ktedonobacteraceae bacterium]
YRHFLESVAVALATAFANAHTHQEALKRTQELAELDRAKTVFFQNISHEFRTPLTLSLGPLESLLADREHLLAEEQRAHIEMAHHHLLRQLKLVNTLLDFARIESGRADATYQPTDLAQLTRELASSFQSATEKAGLRLFVDCSPLPESVYVDQDMWEKMVLNLLSNAFKFTFEGSIHVTLQGMDASVVLRVQDTGVGIRKEDVPHLFERFYQAHAPRARTREGSGIGLALVQELVHLHGGSITVESQEGVGTAFTVRLPTGSGHLPVEHVKKTQALTSVALGTDPFVTEALRWLPETLQSAGETTNRRAFTVPFSVPTVQMNEKTSTATPGRVLIVDDNADMRAYLERLLSPWYQVQLAADGETALSVARESLPDLIISDVMMPGLDGFALLDALRTQRSTASIPMILLSARAGEEAVLEGLAGGANDYLTKPFSAREILARVQLWLEIARLRQEAEQARQHLYDLFMQAPAIICVLRGPSHIYELANPRYHQLVGQRTLLGLPIREALPELEGQGLYELLDQVYTSGQPFFGTEIKIIIDRDNDGHLQEGSFNFVYQPTRNGAGEVDGILVHAVEVTEQVQGRQRLQTFLGIASHELKNPLTSIKGNVDLALRRLKGTLVQVPAEARSLRDMLEGITLMLTRASQQIAFENRLISDLVDSSRIQAEKLELQLAPADIGAVVQEAIAEQRRIMPERTISLDLPTSQLPYLLLDADRMGQVITNYLSNALKYSGTEQEVFVSVEARESSIRVSVRDQGEGLNAEVQDHIWERFYRVPGVEVKSGSGIGLGLGLYICRTIVEEHGGRVGVESQRNQGATFWFTLPVPS